MGYATIDLRGWPGACEFETVNHNLYSNFDQGLFFVNSREATMTTPLSPRSIHSPLPGVVSPTGLRPALKHTISRPTSPIPSPTPPVLSPGSIPQPLPPRSRQNSFGNGGSGVSSRPLTVPTPSGSRYTTKVSFDTFDAPNTDADTLFSFTLQVLNAFIYLDLMLTIYYRR